MRDLILVIIFAPIVGFIINFIFGRSFDKKISSLAGCLAPVISFFSGLYLLFHLTGSSTFTLLRWMPLETGYIDISFLMDALSLRMCLIVTGIGTLIHIYSIGYMYDDKRFPTFFSYLNLFIFFMLLLVFGNNLLTMFIGWEGVGLCSFLLIGFWFTETQRAQAARKAFITNRVGDLFFIIGAIICLYVAGINDFNFDKLLSRKDELLAANYGLMTAAGIFLFLSCCGKSAQIPLYIWLPDAMAGPTPVSALIHAATMVTAGVFLFLRVGELFLAIPVVKDFILIVAALTALMASLMAITEFNIKKILAYSTISQLGYMFCGLPDTASPFEGCSFAHLTTHAFFKALLFLTAGYIIHNLHNEEDIRKMGGLGKKMPLAFWSFLIGGLSLAGIPPLAGFFSKEAIFGVLTGSPVEKLVQVVLIAGSLLTTLYIFRCIWYVFIRETDLKAEIHKSSSMSFVLVALSVLTIFSPVFIMGFGDIQHIFIHAFTSPIVLLIAASVSIIYLINYYYSKGLAGRFKAQKVYDLLANKFYVDEIIDFLVITPFKMKCFILWYFLEDMVIETRLIGGTTRSLYRFSSWVSGLHKGLLNNYLFYMFILLIGIFLYSVKLLTLALFGSIAAVFVAMFAISRVSLKGGRQ